jgi:hypothetical protein
MWICNIPLCYQSNADEEQNCKKCNAAHYWECTYPKCKFAKNKNMRLICGNYHCRWWICNCSFAVIDKKWFLKIKHSRVKGELPLECNTLNADKAACFICNEPRSILCENCYSNNSSNYENCGNCNTPF